MKDSNFLRAELETGTFEIKKNFLVTLFFSYGKHSYYSKFSTYYVKLHQN
jgi:hypothetical protein